MGVSSDATASIFLAALQGICANPNFFGPIFQQSPEAAVDKFDPRCDHEWVGAQSPRGGVEGTCKKCGVTRYVS
jgi:hypothetical protein